jgi:hypothetical protein
MKDNSEKSRSRPTFSLIYSRSWRLVEIGNFDDDRFTSKTTEFTLIKPRSLSQNRRSNRSVYCKTVSSDSEQTYANVIRLKKKNYDLPQKLILFVRVPETRFRLPFKNRAILSRAEICLLFFIFGAFFGADIMSTGECRIRNGWTSCFAKIIHSRRMMWSYAKSTPGVVPLIILLWLGLFDSNWPYRVNEIVLLCSIKTICGITISSNSDNSAVVRLIKPFVKI